MMRTKYSRSRLAPSVLTAAMLVPFHAGAAEAWKLPAEKTLLREGAGRELVIGQCLLCHSADYISTQPRLTRAQWQAAVDKMRLKYGAPVQTNQVTALVHYLTVNYGPPPPAR